MKNVLLRALNDARTTNNNIFNTKIDINFSIYSTFKKYLKSHNIETNTLDLGETEAADKIIYFDTPYIWNRATWKTINANRQKNILFCFEPPIVNPFNYMKFLHKDFTKVYTWYDDYVDNKKYFKFYWPQSNFGLETKAVPFNKKKNFIALINGNKLPFWPFYIIRSFGKEIYSQRITAIEYFEKNAPAKFSLYGRGWNKPKKRNLSEKIFGFKKYVTYKGEVDDKIKLLSTYKYCLCFENITDANGYLTEKIFDCFKARCVPIYWGASNITNYIPKDCFIDYREFGSYDKLLSHLESITEKQYTKYIENIERLLSDRNFLDRWFEDGFAKFFLKAIQ